MSLKRSQNTISTHKKSSALIYTNNEHAELKTWYHLQSRQKNSYTLIKICTVFVCWKFQNADEKNQRRSKWMERQIMFNY